jgi:hypothetical protein
MTTTITTNTIHPLVRDLYKRALLVGRDYPLGLDYVRPKWKRALRNSSNTPSCYSGKDGCESGSCSSTVKFPYSPECEQEIRKAVGRGRFMVREMIGVIQLKKYRAMNQRYGQLYEDDSSVGRINNYLRQQPQESSLFPNGMVEQTPTIPTTTKS